MTWVQTHSGRAFDLRAPSPEMVCPEDIAYSLSMQCRYGGHTLTFYSVAEHCCLIHDWLAQQGGPEWLPVAGLLHDAHECYVSDFPAPMKRLMEADALGAMEAYERITMRIDAVVAARFGLSPAWLTDPRVRDADYRILLDERDQVMAPPPRDWGIDGLPLGVEIEGWAPWYAEREYLRRLEAWKGVE